MNRRDFFKGCTALLAGIGIGHGCTVLNRAVAEDDDFGFPDGDDDPEVEPFEPDDEPPPSNPVDTGDEEIVWNGTPVRKCFALKENDMFIITKIDSVRKTLTVRGV